MEDLAERLPANPRTQSQPFPMEGLWFDHLLLEMRMIIYLS